MKQIKRKLRRPFEWLGIFVAELVFATLPRRAMQRVADMVSSVAYAFDGRGRALMDKNLRIMFGDRLSPAQRKTIARRSYRNMARTIAHIFWTSRNSAKRAAEAAEMTPICHEVLARWRPAITVSGHLGCWEVLSQLVYLEGRNIMSVAKPIGSKAMTALLMKSRRALGQKIIPSDGAFLPLLQGLKDGVDVGLLVDQFVRKKDGGTWVRFFGQPFCASVAPAFLSAKTHAPILVAWCRPLKDGRYRCEFIAEIPWEKGMDVRGRTVQVLRALEGAIRRHPSCWVLNYRYWEEGPTAEELADLIAREKREKGEKSE